MTISFPWLISALFIAIRLSMVVLFTPIHALRQVPIHVRLLFIICLSIILVSNLATIASDDSRLLLRCLAEFTNGLLLSLCLFALFSIYHIAGQLIDNQIGFNSIVLFNPHEHSQESLSARLLTMLAVLFFFTSNSHVWLFKGLSYSFQIIPPGGLNVFQGLTPIIKLFGLMFSLSLVLASPLIITLLSVDFCSALLTRTMPQINAYFFSLPAKIIFGLILLIVLLPYFSTLTQSFTDYWLHSWQEVVQ